VAGTTDAGPDRRSRHPGDIGAQTKAVLAIVEAALVEAGFALTDVVRIRMFVTDISRADEVMAVQGAVFASIRPAATMVEVSALMDPSLLIEIEADAQRGA
jgi:enamine deaminase RidA (YjgF/YER057c/UK114 family)